MNKHILIVVVVFFSSTFYFSGFIFISIVRKRERGHANAHPQTYNTVNERHFKQKPI